MANDRESSLVRPAHLNAVRLNVDTAIMSFSRNLQNFRTSPLSLDAQRTPPPRPPSKLLWAAEFPRAAWAVADLIRQRHALRSGPRSSGRPVLLLPGLFNSDRSNFVLRRHLRALGHDARGWGLGRNLGVRTIGPDAARLVTVVEKIAAETGQPVALVGISLGGIMARLIAHRHPDIVRQVVTVASPYAGDGRATNVWRAFEWVTGERLSDPAVQARSAELAQPLPIPATAIWSRSDGLVNGLICHAPGEANCRAVEIRSSHLGVQLRPEVLRIVADALADPPSAGEQPAQRLRPGRE